MSFVSQSRSLDGGLASSSEPTIRIIGTALNFFRVTLMLMLILEIIMLYRNQKTS